MGVAELMYDVTIETDKYYWNLIAASARFNSWLHME
jgi:hypothetical protein